MKRFILQTGGRDNAINYIYPDLNPENIPSQYALDRSQNYFPVFLPDDTSFKGMIPEYIGDNPPKQVHTICDMHDFIRQKPYAQAYPVSKRFKELLEKFIIPNTKFYQGSVLWNETEYPYFVWHLLTEKYQQNIAFEKSSFGNYNFIRSRWENEDIVRVDMFEELLSKEKELGWRDWGFRKAVMKPQFGDIDSISMHRYGIIISERLKDAIESAQLTNVSIISCPIEFEFSDQI